MIEAQKIQVPVVASTNVPAEVFVSNCVTLLPLGCVEQWAEGIDKKVFIDKEKVAFNEGMKYYDINMVGELLEREYKLTNRNSRDM